MEAEVCMGIFRGHSGWLHSVCFSQDGERIVTASTDETCKVCVLWKGLPGVSKSVWVCGYTPPVTTPPDLGNTAGKLQLRNHKFSAGIRNIMTGNEILGYYL